MGAILAKFEISFDYCAKKWRIYSNTVQKMEIHEGRNGPMDSPRKWKSLDILGIGLKCIAI